MKSTIGGLAVPQAPLTLGRLWRELLPLAWSDLNLALVDPAITTTLTRLPGARMNLAAVGVGKAVAVVFESPIYKLLHASNALARSSVARRALFRFALLAIAVLTTAFAVMLLPPVYRYVSHSLLGIDGELADRVHVVLWILLAWPAAIAMRRYFQGLLIRAGHLRAVQWSATARLATCIGVLLAGGPSGAVLAAVALIAGACTEAALLSLAAWRAGATQLGDAPAPLGLPRDVRGVFRFYWPLASSMIVVWGGRAVLIGVIARATDGPIALAAWPAAWGVVLLLANATRMVNQVVIRNRGRAPDQLLLRFALSVGAAGTAILLLVTATPLCGAALAAFVGHDPELLASIRPVLLMCAVIPLTVSLQNALQGMLIDSGRTGRVNAAASSGTVLLLGGALALVAAGVSGGLAASIAMDAALIFETALLLKWCR